VDEGAAVTTRGDDVAPEVIEAFLAGDEEALAAIYRRWSSLIYSVALRSLGTVADAEDITQQVFARAWAARDDFDHARAELPAWLIEITRHELADARTARNQQARVRPPGTTLTRERDEIEPSDLADRLVVADEMAHLADVPQQVIRLALTEGLTATEIAERLQLPADQVRSHLSGSLLELRDRLAVLHDAR
jgi:RNA polymerase sigma factor (sigma-70 family)